MAEVIDEPLLVPEQLDAIREIGVEKRFRAGERLVNIGAEATEVFYLVDGLVKIVVVAPSGAEQVFARRRPGDFIGEMSTLNNERRSADVVAVEPTTTIMVGAARFERFLEEFPSVALALLRMQTRRLNEMTKRSMLGARSVKARVAQRLLDLSARVGFDSGIGPGHEIVVKITQSDLAQWVDASREWTSKALGELQRQEAIRTERGRVVIIDLRALEEATIDD